MKANTVEVLDERVVSFGLNYATATEDGHLELGFIADVRWLNFTGWEKHGVNGWLLWDSGKIIGDVE